MSRIGKVTALTVILVSVLAFSADAVGNRESKTENISFEEHMLEIFVDNQLVVREGHIKNVEPVTKRRAGYSVPFSLTKEGKERFAEKTEGEGGNCAIIYLNRPRDSILVFRENFLEELGAGSEGLSDIRYDRGSHHFVFAPASPPDRETDSFALKVPSVPVKSGVLSPNSESYILSLKETGKIGRVVLLGERGGFTEVVENGRLAVEGEPVLPVSYSPKKGEESPLDWLSRVSGLKAWPVITPNVAGEPLSTLVIPVQSEKKAEEIRKTLMKPTGVRPGDIGVAGLIVSRKEVGVGENVTVIVRCENPQNKAVVDNVVVRLGERTKEKEVFLGPRENETTQFLFRASKKGVFEIKAGGYTGTVKVTEIENQVPFWAREGNYVKHFAKIRDTRNDKRYQGEGTITVEILRAEKDYATVRMVPRLTWENGNVLPHFPKEPKKENILYGEVNEDISPFYLPSCRIQEMKGTDRGKMENISINSENVTSLHVQRPNREENINSYYDPETGFLLKFSLTSAGGIKRRAISFVLKEENLGILGGEIETYNELRRRMENLGVSLSRLDASDRMLRRAISKGKVGASFSLTIEEGKTVTRTEFQQEQINLEAEEIEAGSKVKIKVESGTDKGRTLLLNLGRTLFPDPAEAEVLYDGREIDLADDYSDVLDPTDEGQPEYLVLTGSKGSQILVSVPSFSTHTITVAMEKERELPLVWIGLAVATAVIILAVLAVSKRY